MRTLLAAALLAVPSATVAQSPGPGVRFLMAEPASLFDLGLQALPRNYDLMHHFYRWGSKNPEASLDLNWWYEQQEQRIVGSVTVYDDDSDEQAMSAGCETVLEQLTIWVNKSVPQVFLHANWAWDDRTEQTELITDELRSMFLLSCSVEGQSIAGTRLSKSITPWAE